MRLRKDQLPDIKVQRQKKQKEKKIEFKPLSNINTLRETQTLIDAKNEAKAFGGKDALLILQSGMVSPSGKATYLDEVRNRMQTERRFNDYKRQPAIRHDDLFTNNKMKIQIRKRGADPNDAKVLLLPPLTQRENDEILQREITQNTEIQSISNDDELLSPDNGSPRSPRKTLLNDFLDNKTND